MSKYSEIEAALLGLLKGKHSSLSLSFNNHAGYYPNAATAMVDEMKTAFGFWADEDWVSIAERDKAVAENSVWCLRWHPENQVGFEILCASSLTALLEGVFAQTEDSDADV